MLPTRLFHTLIICGAALTGGAVGTAVIATTVAGCSDEQAASDAAVVHDMAVPDLSRRDFYVFID
jgi:hypothetical protein